MKFFYLFYMIFSKIDRGSGFFGKKQGFFKLLEKTGGKNFGRAVIDFGKFSKNFKFFETFFTYSDFKKFENFSFLTMGSSPWFSQEIWPKKPEIEDF